MEKVKILYVDDEIINLQLFQMIFEDKYNVLIVNSGEEGLKVLDKNQDISVVISDMKMPDMNGLEFINVAKSKFPEIDYYILTGFHITEEIDQALKQNMIKQYFSKPFNAKEIETAIEG